MAEIKRKEMFVEERIKNVADYIRLNGRATNDELSKKFNVSPVTIRRDLTYIEKKFNIKRTYGGAIYYVSELKEFSFDEKYKQNISYKKRIAEKAVEIIKEGDTIFLDGGSTNYNIVLLLARFKDLKIVTNSIPILTILRKMDNEVIVLGGRLRKKSFTTVGSMANNVLTNFNVNTAFIGATGIDLNGDLYSPSEIEAYTKQESIKHASFAVLVSDSSKVNVKSFARFGNLSDFDMLIINKEIEKSFHRKIKKHISKIVLA